MSFVLSTRSEILKTKRTASFWLSIIGAAFIPGIFFLAYYFNPEGAIRQLKSDPWNGHFTLGWQVLNAFLFPMFVILVCTLIPQIEFRNNTWKQVFSSPQPVGHIFFSKFVTIHLLIFFFYVLFIVLMIASGVVTNLLHKEYTFLEKSIDGQKLMRLSAKTYISILGISALQYWLSLRFKNFIAPVGIGLALVIGAVIARNFGWEHIYKVPYAHPLLTVESFKQVNRPFLENHEWNSLLYAAAFLLLGFLDLKLRKEKG